MKIAVDGYEIGLYATGVGRVIQNILINLFDFLPEHTFFVFTREIVASYTQSRVNQVILPSRGGYFRWQNGPFWRNLRKIRPDLLIAPNYTLPYWNRWDSILFEHDISLVAHPEWYTRKMALARRLLIRRSLKRADRIVVPSEFTKEEVTTFFGLDSAKIKVLYYGVEDRFERSAKETVERWKKEKGLAGKKMVGFLGSIFNRRHVPELVEAVELLRKEFPDVALCIVGRDLSQPRQDIARMLDKDWIRWDLVLSEKELPIFYSAADVFAYISSYEGFGLPPLEALACGTVPVLLRSSSLKEIFPDLAVMVDKPEPKAVAEALKIALTDEKRRQEILRNFSERRNLFSWRKVAEEFSLIIKILISEKGQGKGHG